MKSIFLSILLTLTFIQLAAQERKTKNVLIITLDGYRWKELFRGADSALLFSKEFNSQDSLQKRKKFWDEDMYVRREKLMPFFWNTIAVNGQIYGNRDAGNYVDVKNRYWFSYPGYNEMFTGYPDTMVNSNDFGPNPNVTVQEFINKKKEFAGKVAAFASWSAFNRILNEKRCGFPVIAGYENLDVDTVSPEQQTLNEVQHFLPKIFGASERPDAITFMMARDYMKRTHPRLLQVSLIETDAFAHQGKYDYYLDAAHNTDQMIADLWNQVQSDPFYKDQTTLFIAVDHGRGDGEKWRNHARAIEHANEIWFAVMGPDTKFLGEVRKKGQLYQNQYAKTIAALLGISFTSTNPIGEIIESVIY